MDDAELVRQVLQGNPAAYTELINRYTAQIAALCRARVRRSEDVEDLVQDTFFRGLDSLASLREPEKFGSWLYRIARNLCSDWFRDPHQRHVPLDACAGLLVVPETVGGNDRSDRMADLKACIRRLPLEEREVIELYYSGGRLTYQEIADRLGVSFGQVNRLLTTARRRLRAWLEDTHSPGSPPA
jgi:RNA polymerase sigma-70 factor (ECF subfamily)